METLPSRAWVTLYEEGGRKALLTIHQAPGKVSRLTLPIREQLQVRLNEPQGFASYAAIRQYLAATHALALRYRAVHACVRYKVRAKPKAPRRAHPKKSLRPSRSFNSPSRATS